MIAEPPTKNSNLTVQDQVRLFLGQFGQKNISTTIEEIAQHMEQPRTSVYQAIHRLEEKGEIDLEKELLENGREKIIGIKLIKLEQSGRTYQRAADRSGRITRIKPTDLNSVITGIEPTFPALLAYMHKRLAVENMREQAINAGMDADSVIQFTHDDISEEALVLFKLWTELRTEYDKLKEAYKMQGFDLEAEKRNVLYLRQKVREETTEGLIEIGEQRGERG